MPSIGDAWVDVRADTSNMAKDVDKGVTRASKAADKAMRGLEKSVQDTGKAAKLWLAQQAWAAVTAIKDAVYDTIRAASDLNESQNAVRVSFGESADAVEELGKSAAQNLGLSTAEFNQLSVSVSAFTEKIAQGLGQDVPGVVDTLTTRIADFASVMNLEVADAFEKFRSGLAGESEPLRKFGIDVSAATVEQVALKAGIIATGEAMSESDKVTARYLAIMQQTEKMAGDFANTSDEFANSQRILNAEIENAKAEIGEQLLPVLAQLFSTISRNLDKIINVAEAFFVVVGVVNDADAAMSKLERTMGEDFARTAEGLFVAFQDGSDTWRSWAFGADEARQAAEALSDEMGEMTSGELMRLQGGLEAMAEAYGLSTEQTEALAAAIEDELSARGAEAADMVLRNLNPALQGLTDTTIGLADETGDLGDEVKTATDLLKEQQDMVRANIDPIFRLREATQKHAAAQVAVQTAIDTFKEGSPEHLDALVDLSDAALDLSEAEDDVRVNTNLTKDAFIAQQIELGLTRRQAELLADEMEALDRITFKPKVISISYTAPSGVTYRQHGGPVTAGRPYIVGEAGPELFVPRVSGQIISNQNMSSLTVGDINVHIAGTVSDFDARRAGKLAADEVIDRLSRARIVQ